MKTYENNEPDLILTLTKWSNRVFRFRLKIYRRGVYLCMGYMLGLITYAIRQMSKGSTKKKEYTQGKRKEN